MSTATATAIPPSPIATARHPRDGRPVPRWARVAAHLVPLTTLPAGLWRIALGAGLGLGISDASVPLGYVVALSLVAESAATLTLALVQPWGERVPAWIPVIGSRRIPPLPVVAAAALGAVALQAIWGFAFFNFVEDPARLGIADNGWRALLVACYTPLIAWAPLLGAVTFAYWRRRCRD